KAYFILSFIAFIEMSIGFAILGVDYAIPIATFIALLDFLPLIGVGGILIPWGIYEIIIGQRFVGIGLIVIYIIIYIVRSALEPRVLGKQIGLSSLVTIVAMFVGFKIFGFVGFIIAPMVVIVIKQLNDSKKINIYR
ncbi:MAG TPA: AI-2E family transporter, partial [Clostridia bacterium]|nr:AI-2E family transporter [Clostridia bacterium]